jgi:hypothetical protein
MAAFSQKAELNQACLSVLFCSGFGQTQLKFLLWPRVFYMQVLADPGLHDSFVDPGNLNKYFEKAVHGHV